MLREGTARRVYFESSPLGSAWIDWLKSSDPPDIVHDVFVFRRIFPFPSFSFFSFFLPTAGLLRGNEEIEALESFREGSR